jgi:hypothetical protein
MERLPLFEVCKDVGGTQEAIFEGPDDGWNGTIFQVKLLVYTNGGMDIHRQTGSQYQEHIKEAEKVLASRGLMIDPEDRGAVGCTGMYRRVIKNKIDFTKV